MCESKPAVGDRQGRVDVADERLRPVGEALVDPVDLVRVLVALEQVLVLVREDALVEGGRAGALVQASGTGRPAGSRRCDASQSKASIVITLRSKNALICDEKNPAMYVKPCVLFRS